MQVSYVHLTLNLYLKVYPVYIGLPEIGHIQSIFTMHYFYTFYAFRSEEHQNICFHYKKKSSLSMELDSTILETKKDTSE